MTQYVLSGDPAPTGTRRLHRVAPTVWTRVPGFVATLALFGATASAAQSTARRDPVVLQLQREIRDATDLSRQQLGFVADWARAEALVVLEQATAAGGSTVLEERATSLANAARLLEALEEDAERLEQAALAINRESARTAIWTGAGVSLLQLWADGWSALTGEATGDDMRRTTSELRLRLDEVTAIGSALDTVQAHADSLLAGARRTASQDAKQAVDSARAQRAAAVAAANEASATAKQRAARIKREAEAARRETPRWAELQYTKDKLANVEADLEASRRATPEWEALAAARAALAAGATLAVRHATAAWSAREEARTNARAQQSAAQIARTQTKLWKKLEETQGRLRKAQEEWDEPFERRRQLSAEYDAMRGNELSDRASLGNDRASVREAEERGRRINSELNELGYLTRGMEHVMAGHDVDARPATDRVIRARRRAKRLWDAKERATREAAEAEARELAAWVLDPARRAEIAAVKELETARHVEESAWAARVEQLERPVNEATTRESAAWLARVAAAQHEARALLDEATRNETEAWENHPARVAELEAAAALDTAAESGTTYDRQPMPTLAEVTERFELEILATDRFVRARASMQAVMNIWDAWEAAQTAGARLQTRVKALNALRH